MNKQADMVTQADTFTHNSSFFNVEVNVITIIKSLPSCLICHNKIDNTMICLYKHPTDSIYKGMLITIWFNFN